MSEGKFKYELSDVELKERGDRLAVVLGRIELYKEEKKAAAANSNGILKALGNEIYVLALAIREGYEMRDVAEQQEMALLDATCRIYLHKQRFPSSTDLSVKLCDNCRTSGSMEEKP